MTLLLSSDLDYLTAWLHARRSRMADRQRLDELCRSRSLAELGHAVFPGCDITQVNDFQRRLVQDLVLEISGCLRHLSASPRKFVTWLQSSFQLQNTKVLLRGFLNRSPPNLLQPHLLELPAGLELDAEHLFGAKALDEFIRRLPAGAPRDCLEKFATAARESRPAFLLEAALDAGYFEELLARLADLPGNERDTVQPLVLQEVNQFQFLLAARGKFHFGFTADDLLPLCVNHPGWLTAALSAPDILTAAKSVVGIVIDGLPAGSNAPEGASRILDLAAVEELAWNRFRRLANAAFRRSHTGIGAVAGYLGLRRMEIAGLVTLSEGIRLGVNPEIIRARLGRRAGLEVAHV